jgi:CelD/BcsL family acetyltransferase involved in cellulose biosynthesis
MESTLSLNVKVFHSLEDLADRAGEWNALVDECDINTIYQTWQWHASWLSAFGERVEPLVLVVEDQNMLVGIAPLMHTRRWFWGGTRRVFEFIGTNASGTSDFIVKRSHPEARGLMLEWLMEHRELWDALDLVDIPGESCTLALAEPFFRQRGLRTHTRLIYEAPTRILRDQWSDWRVTRTANLRWQRNRVHRQGRLEFDRLTERDEIAFYLDKFFELHIRRRQITAMPSFFIDDAYKAFYRSMVRELGEKEQVVLYVERLNKAPIALGIALEYNDRLIGYQHTFDLEYGRLSPGTLLVMHMLDDAVERGLGEFDLAAGEQAYKYRITNHSRSLYALRVFQHLADYGRMRLILGFKDQVSRSPRALTIARRVTDRLGLAPQVSTLR